MEIQQQQFWEREMGQQGSGQAEKKEDKALQKDYWINIEKCWKI